MTACLHIMVKKVNKLIKTIFDCITCLCFYVLRGQDHRTQLVLNMGIIYTGPRPSGNILQKKKFQNSLITQELSLTNEIFDILAVEATQEERWPAETT